MRSTETGREGLSGELAQIGTVRGTFSYASPEQIQKHRQLQHPVLHRIVCRPKDIRLAAPAEGGTPAEALRPGDVFEMAEDLRRFTVRKEAYDIGDLGHWVVFFVEEGS